MLDLTLRDVARAVGETAPEGAEDCHFSGVSVDTRTLGPGTLFVPLLGDNFDAHDFVDQALAAGARGVLFERRAQEKVSKALQGHDVVSLAVDDTLRALGDVAHALVKRSRLPTVAITGSAGKTSTKDMAALMLATRGPVCATPGNFNNLVGLPLTVFRCEREHRFLLLEMGMNAPGEIARLAEIAAPDVGLVTNVGAAHIGRFGSLEGVAEAKGELYAGLSEKALAVVNADDPLVVAQADKRCAARRRSFGRTVDADIRIEDVTMGTAGTTEATLRLEGGRHRVQLSVLGAHNVWNAAAALAATRDYVSGIGDALAALHGHKGPENRMERFERAGAVVISDCYNANPKSTVAALDAIAAVPVARRRIAVLGDMLELGDLAPTCHRETGAHVAELGFDQLVAVGEFAEELASGARRAGMTSVRIQTVPDALDAASHLELARGDWVLIKGSRGLKMERLLDELGVR